MEFVWVDLQHQPEGADVWVSFQGSGILQCYLIPSPQFGAFAKGDAVDCFQFDVAPPQHAVQIPREGLWHVVMRGAGEAEVRVTPPARLDANIRAILQPEKHQDPTPEPGVPDLAELPLHAASGSAAENPPLPSGQAGWQKLLVPSVGMDQKRLDFLRENFFFDNVYPTSVSTSRNAVGSVITAQMSDGSTFEQWIADPGPMLPGLSSSTPVLSPEQRISMARVKNSPLFGDSKLLEDGTIEPENPWYLDLLDGLDFISLALLILPGTNLAGAAGKAAIAAAKRAVAKVVERDLKRKAEGAALKAKAQADAKAAAERELPVKETPKPKPVETNLKSEFEYNIRPERLDHTFQPKHELGGIVNQYGGREKTIRVMLDKLRGNVPQQGVFERVVTISGEQVTIRGFVDNGVIKLSTAFVKVAK